MESTVDGMSKAYDELLNAVTKVLESGEAAEKKGTALADFKQHLELFLVSCDKAHELVDEARQRLVGLIGAAAVDAYQPESNAEKSVPSTPLPSEANAEKSLPSTPLQLEANAEISLPSTPLQPETDLGETQAADEPEEEKK